MMDIESHCTDCHQTSPGTNEHISHVPKFKGYDFTFHPPLDASYECAICLLCQRDPVQTICGHRFCSYCIELWFKNNGKRCPKDNEPLKEEDVFPDNCAKREIALLTIKCPNSISGCAEIVTIGNHEEHLQNCHYKMVACPHGCHSFIRQKSLSEHIKNSCINRPVECKTCRQYMPFKDIENHEKTVCPHGSCQCPHCEKSLERYQLQRHLAKNCSQIVVTCCFSAFGCTEKMTRTELLQHIEDDRMLHDEMICELVHKLVAKGLESSHPISSGRAEADPSMLSPSVWLEGAQPLNYRKGSTEGDSIPLLSLSPKLPKDFLERREPSSPFSMPSTSVAKPCEKMNDRSERYIQELFKRVITLEQCTQQMQNEMNRMRQRGIEQEEYLYGKYCNGSFKWSVKYFSNLKDNALQGNSKSIHSPSFYTSPCGYKFCLRVSFQTNEKQQDDPIISIFVHLMHGDHDDELKWPFQGSISLSIINKLKPEKTITEEMRADPQSIAFQKPSSDPPLLRNRGLGYREFTSSKIVECEKFLQDDTLIIKARIEPF